MELNLLTRAKRAFNVFMNRDPTKGYYGLGAGYSSRPDRARLTRGNERTILNSIYNRIALDVSSMTFTCCKVDENGRYLETDNNGLNRCLNLEANLDQTGRAFIQDSVMSMLDEGVVAMMPIDTDSDVDMKQTGSYDILTMRTGKIITWFPEDVRISAYDDRDGIRKEIVMKKRNVGIVENTFYSVMNEPNSTLQRLRHKLSLLDATDDFNASGKIDLIIQLPYVVKGQTRKEMAESRRKEIEDQLTGAKYGVAYIDGTERITQLNRSLENNLMNQIEYLTNLLFSQLNITQSILDGSADEQTMLNYYTRTVEPIVAAIVDELKRKFITKTAMTQGHTILYFRDPFKLVPVNNIAEIADKFTRNEIMTSNEIRQIIGMKPSKDPKADELRNSNLREPAQTVSQTRQVTEKEEEIQNG